MRFAALNTNGRNTHVLVAWIALTVALTMLAFSEVKRVEDGRLFALTLPHEHPPSDVERIDAQHSAAYYKYLAPIAVAMIGIVLPFIVDRVETESPRNATSKLLLLGFTLGVLADLGTTIAFFHSHGIENELHPGIRLLGYAYGRTLGPIPGKAIQAAGIFFVSRKAGRFGSPLILVVTIVYFLAAMYNLSKAT